MAEKINDKRKKLILELFKDDLYVPMKRKELAVFMQVSEEQRPDFDAILDEMLDEGSIEQTKRGKLVLRGRGEAKKAPSFDCYTGKYIGNAKGFGFVEVEGLEEDFFIPAGDELNALNGDTVEIEVVKQKDSKKGTRAEAKVVRVAERSKEVIVGTYEACKNYGFVVPDNVKFNTDIFIPKEKSKGAVTGHKVIVELTDYGDKRKNPEGVVTEIIGHSSDPGVDILSIALSFGIPYEFPEKVMNQVENVAKPVSAADMAGRKDLRDLMMVTIDGEDAKDLDDAVSLTMEGNLYVLGVHIADVSNYVQENSALDKEALKRGTSVYLANGVVPMLPHALCNGICSLNAGEDRLAMSVIMKIDDKGNVKDYDIFESVVNINKRMCYTGVKKIIEEHDEAQCKEDEPYVEMLLKMQELSLILRDKRHQRGAIDFDFPETKLVLDEEGHPVELKPYERNEATKLIESFMLAANETVAEHFFWQQVPFLYRVHEEPEDEKIEKLRTFIKNFGYFLKQNKDEIHPKEIQKLLDKIAGTEEEALISRIALRSMSKAKYSDECDGHFGLSAKYYTHFTSPIRRYPDLQIHRIIKDVLRGRMSDEKREHYASILGEVAAQTSRTERRADETERETVKLKKAEYMQAHMHEEFEGVISGVTNWGLYVELPNTVEGLVHISTIDGDFYNFNEAKYELVGEKTGRVFRLGQRVKVMVKDVDMTLRAVDFLLADFTEDPAIHDFYKNGR